MNIIINDIDDSGDSVNHLIENMNMMNINHVFKRYPNFEYLFIEFINHNYELIIGYDKLDELYTYIFKCYNNVSVFENDEFINYLVYEYMCIFLYVII
jgi:hypothetical protein